MNAVFQDLRRIWRVTTIQRDERAMMLLGWLALGFGVLALIGSTIAMLKNHGSPLVVLQILCGVLACWLAFVWVMLFVPASVLLNSPANARLVPRQRRRLLQMAGATWVLITAGIAFMVGSWAAVPAVGFALIGFAFVRSGKPQASMLFVLTLNWPQLSRFLLPQSVVQLVESPAGILVLSVLLVPIGAWTLRTLYPAGGDGHLAGRSRQVTSAQGLLRQGMSNTSPPGAVTGWTTARAYAFALRRDLRRPRADTMLMHALGPVAHWSAWIVAVLMMPVVGAVARLLMAWRGGDALRAIVDGPMGPGFWGLTSMIAYSTAVYSLQIRKTTGEQALLRLTPLAGNAALLNRRLAGRLLKRALCNAAMLAASILLTTLIIGGGQKLMVQEAALSILGGQVAMWGLLGDYAGEGGWSVPRALQAGLLAAAELLVALGLYKLTGTSMWAYLAAIAFAGGAFQVQRAWGRMLAAAPAFPAGRMK